MIKRQESFPTLENVAPQVEAAISAFWQEYPKIIGYWETYYVSAQDSLEHALLCRVENMNNKYPSLVFKAVEGASEFAHKRYYLSFSERE